MGCPCPAPSAGTSQRARCLRQRARLEPPEAVVTDPSGSHSGRPELNSGALHRYLAEAAWYPTALLPTDTLRWTTLDDDKAQATLSHGSDSVSLEFRFNAAGEISGVYTPGRWERFSAGYRLRAWEGHFHGYERKANMLVPTGAEVGWYHAGCWQKVWSASVVESSYELMR